MKYLKLFEKFIDEPKFIRFNHTDLLGQEDRKQISPQTQRTMIGPENVNSVLIKNGFPDKKNCIHFMDQNAFDPGYKILYGRNIYQVEIDDESKLGWSFFITINDWFYKSLPYERLIRYPEKLPDTVKDLLNSEFGILGYPGEDENFDNSQIMIKSFNLEKMSKYLLEYKVIGTGKIDDLKRNEFYGGYPLFVWTNDDVIISRYVEPAREPREARPYKNKPLLTERDFTKIGVSPDKIKDFYSSDSGISLKRLQIRSNKEPEKFIEFRQEALSLLSFWNKNLI